MLRFILVLGFIFVVGLVATPASAKGTTQDGGPALDIVRVVADGTVVDRSCRLVFGSDPIVDANGDGVVHIVGDDLVVECEGRLLGASAGARPDDYRGTGIVVLGRNVRLVAPRVSGFKVGIHVDGAYAARVEDADVSDNFRQHLGSTWEREDPTDWLWPHANDEHEWIENYGAGIWVDDARDAHLIRVHARDVQNGIVLDRATGARVRGCDCSFLSGWGCALWRCTDCAITGNRFDHCIRGYAHGRYNRGQDSAGVLMFEQCSNNRVIANSITHGGDGVFAFAGNEALGQAPPEGAADGEPFEYAQAGCNDNVFRFNDLSFAAAHGLELTFSFRNLIESNLFERNAICGAWLGYSRDTTVRVNAFVENGTAGYGAERGGINAEHGQRLSITDNRFEDNAVDVRLWTDADEGLADTPWVAANGRGARDNWIVGNRPADEFSLELEQVGPTATDVPRERVAGDATSRENVRPMRTDAEDVERDPTRALDAAALAVMRNHVLGRIDVEALPARPAPRGRATIVVGEWGPFDWTEPMLQWLESGGAFARLRLLGPAGTRLVDVDVERGEVDVEVERAAEGRAVGPDGLAAAVLRVRPRTANRPTPFGLRVRVRDASGAVREHEVAGLLLAATWDVRFAGYESDPREDPGELRERLAAARAVRMDELDLHFGSGGPLDVVGQNASIDDDLRRSLTALGNDRFGTRATTAFELTPGRWRLRTVSDDGIRVHVDGALAIDDWTWHGPTEHVHEFELDEAREVTIEVAHFELDGWAQLAVELEPAVE